MDNSEPILFLDLLPDAPSDTGLIKPREPPREVRLFKAGENPTRKGTFVFDDEAAQSVREKSADWGVDHALDYGHAMFDGEPRDPERSGRSAGWFKLDVRNGELWATDIKWTETAYNGVSKGEWRYLSPTFKHTKDNHVTELLNVALTNIPATKRAPALVALAVDTPLEKDSHGMDKAFVTALGLSESASDAEAMSKLTATLGIVAALAELTGKSGREVVAEVARYKAEADRAVALAAELAERTKRDNAAAIDKAIADGRLAPVQREWAVNLGEKAPDALTAYLASAPKIVPMGKGATPGTPDPESKDQPLTALDLKTCRDLGIKPEDFVKTRAAHSGRTVVEEGNE